MIDCGFDEFHENYSDSESYFNPIRELNVNQDYVLGDY